MNRQPSANPRAPSPFSTSHVDNGPVITEETGTARMNSAIIRARCARGNQ